MAYFETLQGSCLKVCKVLREPISEKLELLTKIMFGYHGNNKSADFYQDFSQNQQFYLVRAKIIQFSFVLSIFSENNLFPRKMKIARPTFCGS